MREFIDWGEHPHISYFKDAPDAYQKTSQDGTWTMMFDPYQKNECFRYFIAYNPSMRCVSGNGHTENEAIANVMEELRKIIVKYQDLVMQYDSWKKKEA